MTEVAITLSVLGAWVWRECRHDQERQAWTEERQRLMEHARPGLSFEAAGPEPVRRAYGTDADEWAVERGRGIAECGFRSAD